MSEAKTKHVTFLHGAKKTIEMLDCFVVIALNLHAVIWAKELRVLAVPHVVLVVELQVPHDQPVLLWFHGLQLHRVQKKNKGVLKMQGSKLNLLNKPLETIIS